MEWSYHRDTSAESRRSQYAVVFFLPEDLDSAIAPLRERFDPDYNIIGPHVTLVFPFDSEMSLDELAAIIQVEAETTRPISIALNSIGDFYPRAPIIYWNVKRTDELTRLYYQLHSRLGLPIPFKQYQPHVTVAREISHHRVLPVKDKIASYLPDESFEARAVDLVTALPGGKWVSVRTFSLSG